LDRGYRMVEILKQGQYAPLNVVDQVLIIYAGTRGHLDKIPVSQVAAWEKQFLTFIKDRKSEIRDKIMQSRDLDDAAMKAVNDAIAEFQKEFSAGQATAAKA
jgi:F-type H+/Na+-transporting ATPase subunit alpha